MIQDGTQDFYNQQAELARQYRLRPQTTMTATENIAASAQPESAKSQNHQQTGVPAQGVQAAPKAAPESFLDGADVQDESGVLAYYSREAVLACITAALESVAAPKAAPGEPSDASDTLSKVCDLFQIGKLARTESTILINVENTIRFSNMLNAVEHDMFPQPDLPEDDDPYAEMDENPPAPNKWGAKDEADYVAQFRAALLARGFAAPQQEAQGRATVPRFNCWSTNEGDSWFDHPADSQAIYDCLGNDAKVGDEYELTAGWTSVTARYRITEVVGDGEEYEVECISHPHENSAPQPAPAPHLLAADHKGMRVDYTGLLSQCLRALSSSEPANAEMLRQLQGHIQELGKRWYAADTAVVDEFLQLYCVEHETRAALAAQGGSAP